MSNGPVCLYRELTPDAIEKLRGCAWRGNVRELQNVLEKAVMMSDKIRIGATDLVDVLPPDRVRLPFPGNSMHAVDASGGGSALSDTSEAEVRSYDVEFAEFERRLLANALAATGKPRRCGGPTAGPGPGHDVPETACAGF